MSPIDPRELRQSDTPTGVFEQGFRCVKCNYDLTGLPRATVCPECGTTNARPVHDRKRGTGVSRAPVAFISRLGTWLWASAAALLLTWFTSMAAGVFPHPITFGLQLFAGVGWMGALWMATIPKPDRFEPGVEDVFDNPRVRVITVASQGLWLVSIGLLCAAWFPMFSSMERALSISANIVSVFAAIGFIPLGLMLASLAGWMGDHDAENRCRTASWLIAFYGCGILLGPVIDAFIPIFNILYIVFWLAYLIGVILLAVSLFNLARAAGWAVENAKHKSVVSGRRAFINQQQAEEAAAQIDDRLRQVDGPHAPSEAGRSGPPKGVPVPKSHTIKGSAGANPYDITDE
ncbi:MAG: hypothetical protein ACFCBV_14410 [Phycisphaerales bacterium]